MKIGYFHFSPHDIHHIKATDFAGAWMIGVIGYGKSHYMQFKSRLERAKELAFIKYQYETRGLEPDIRHETLEC